MLTCRNRNNAVFVFSHPDYTVGIGISPILSTTRTRGLSPPIEEFRLAPKTYAESIGYTEDVKRKCGLSRLDGGFRRERMEPGQIGLVNAPEPV
jgi:hypothetical protein